MACSRTRQSRAADARRYVHKMMKLISIIILTLVSQAVIAHSEECARWQYASLSFSSKSTIEGNELIRFRTFVLWEEPRNHGR